MGFRVLTVIGEKVFYIRDVNDGNQTAFFSGDQLYVISLENNEMQIIVLLGTGVVFCRAFVSKFCKSFSVEPSFVSVRFVRVKIHQYTSFNDTSTKLSTTVAQLKIFEISLKPQFLDSGCTFYRPVMFPYHVLFFSSKMNALHTTRFHFLYRTNFNKTPL